MNRGRFLLVLGFLICGCAGSRSASTPPASDAAIEAARAANASLDSLPGPSLAKQVATLNAIRDRETNVWRDTPAVNADGTVSAVVEIEMGTRDKFEFDIETNTMQLDRVIDESVGGYPINYGFVPRTFSWDGDPFDVVVLGPKLESGTVAKGAVVGIYHMVDEKGFDPHLVVSPVDDEGRELYTLDETVRNAIAAFVDRYKIPDADKGKWARFVGWGDKSDGLRFLKKTSAFFEEAGP